MNLMTWITGDISKLLIKIIEFTHFRQKILIQNIKNVYSPGFVPKDLGVDEFCELLNDAIDGHIQNRQLVLCDTENINFHISDGLQVKSVIDESARQLLEENRDEYFKSQINKLFENSLNQRVAAELLRLRQETATIDYRTIACYDQDSDCEGLSDN
jgi:flagellar basal body rod protein FlgB